MTRNNKIKVIKIPKSPHSIVSLPRQSFPRMPQLYLELLENKEKIKQSLVNVDFVPEKNIALPEFSNRNDTLENFENKNQINNIPKSPISSRSSKLSYSSGSDLSDNESEIDEKLDNLQDKISKINIDTESSDNESNEDKLSRRLKDLLIEDEDNNNNEYVNQMKSPPTLNELENRGTVKREKHLPDMSRQAYENEDEEDLKREMLFKFDLLKKSYGNNEHIPEFTIHSDYRTMEHSYENTLRKLSIDSTVDNYKTYLIGGFMLVEFVLGKFLKFDMEGFTQQQIVNMKSYERLLIELGEKSYTPEGSDWPVEIRLVFLIIINAAFFVVSKILMKNTGTNILNMINSMNVSNNSSQSVPITKKKMKGPDISFDDLDELSSDEDD
jgi:hypothetical protein